MTIKFTFGIEWIVAPSIFSKGEASLPLQQVLGDCSEGVPPVPIPNTEVKPFSPDGTACASVWESRKSPKLIEEGPVGRPGLSCFLGEAHAKAQRREEEAGGATKGKVRGSVD